MPIFDTEQFKAYLGCNVADGFSGAQIQLAVDAINTTALRYMHRPEIYVDGVEYMHARSLTRNLYLKWPIVSIEEVLEDWGGYFGQVSGGFAANTELTLGEHWVRDPGNVKGPLTRIDGAYWATERGSIKVDYAYGWAEEDIPEDLKRDCMRLASIALDTATSLGPLQSETFGKYSYTLLQPGGNTGGTKFDSDLIGIRKTLGAYSIEVL